MNVLAVILARGGSTRLPGKNLLPFAGYSLVALAAVQARDSRLVTRVCCSSNDETILAEAAEHGAYPLLRPPEMSTATARIEPALKHALLSMEQTDNCTYDYVVCLHAAIPVRPRGCIDALVGAIETHRARGGVTCVRQHPWQWRVRKESGYASTWFDPRDYPPSQEDTCENLSEVNSVMVTPRAQLACETPRRWSSPIVLLEMPEWAAEDIDTQDDYDKLLRHNPVELMRQPCQFHAHIVRHPLLEGLGPLHANLARGRVGVVFGNGPSIDSIPDDVWRTISDRNRFLTIGINRFCISTAAKQRNFAPSLHMIWDRGWMGTEKNAVLANGLRALDGMTWRLTSVEGKQYWPHDEILDPDDAYAGAPHSVYMRHSSADACVNLLARCGCKTIYLFGVELNSSSHMQSSLPVESACCGQDNWAQGAIDGIRSQMAAFPGLHVVCACETSRLVSSKVLPFGLPT